jgi:hypothetical protein
MPRNYPWLLGNLFALILIFGPPVIGAAIGFVAARSYWGWSGWGSFVASVITACLTNAPGCVLYLRDQRRLDEKIAQDEKNDSATLIEWQRRFDDSVFGVPQFFGVGHATGWYAKHLKGFSGFVSVAPKQRIGSARIEVYITPNGFTDAQRQFYLRLLHGRPGLMDPIYPLIQSAYYREFSTAEEFPSEVCLESAKIGRDHDGKLDGTVLGFIYAQDEYVDVHLSGETVTSIHFYM